MRKRKDESSGGAVVYLSVSKVPAFPLCVKEAKSPCLLEN